MTLMTSLKPATLLRTLHDVLWRHKNVSTERHISNAYKDETLVSNYRRLSLSQSPGDQTKYFELSVV